MIFHKSYCLANGEVFKYCSGNCVDIWCDFISILGVLRAFSVDFALKKMQGDGGEIHEGNSPYIRFK
jgi:hypothetical protein